MKHSLRSQGRSWFVVLTSAALLSACSVDENDHPQRKIKTERECTKLGKRWLDGFCYGTARDGAVGPGKDADSDGAAIADTGVDARAEPDASQPVSCTMPGAKKRCYGEKDQTTSLQLPCKAGESTCGEDLLWGACDGEMRPAAERCDDSDNDCDGKTDEMPPMACTLSGSGPQGVCKEGFSICRPGMLACVQVIFPGSETCDGEDDDCDGRTDESTELPCYDGDMGCTKNASGGYDCVPNSSCAPGVLRCEDGKMQSQCSGAVLPRAEAPTSVNQNAVDENCNGTIDEGFSCESGKKYKCYTGQAGTQNESPCKAGERTCSTEGQLGPCNGERTPVVESCANEGEDDDCDGTEDDVLRRGTSCAAASSANGACKQNALWQCSGSSEVCVNGQRADESCDGRNSDEDCDGKVDEGFDLKQDELNCGSCGTRCGSAQTCCSGSCVDTQSSNSHCGACGAPCGTGLTCCSASCKNTRIDAANCGTCGKACLLLGCGSGACNLL